MVKDYPTSDSKRGDETYAWWLVHGNASGRRKAQDHKRTFTARADVRKTLLVAYWRNVIVHSCQLGVECCLAVDLPPTDRYDPTQQRPEQASDVRAGLVACALVERRHQRNTTKIKRHRRRRRYL